VAIENCFAPQVVLIVGEYPHLGKFSPREAIACSELTVLVVAPAVQVTVLIDDVAELLPAGETLELKVHLDVAFVIEDSELVLVLVPGKYLISEGETGEVIVASSYFLHWAHLKNLFHFS